MVHREKKEEPFTGTHIYIRENYLAVGAGLLKDSAKEKRQMDYYVYLLEFQYH